MTISQTDLDLAFDWVLFAPSHANEAWINLKTGATYLYSEYGDNMEDEPDDLESGDWIQLPTKNELDLGTRLVHKFAATLPESQREHISSIFTSRGAYRRFKDYLIKIGQLDNWHEFENRAELEARISWAHENQISISKPDA